MLKKTFLFLTVLTLAAAAAVAPTAMDTVLVPVKIIKLTSATVTGSDTVYDFSGKVNYFLKIGDKDSLNVSLAFVPATGSGATITPYQVSGDVGPRGFVNGTNGQNTILFKFKTTGFPSVQYKAQVSIALDTSRFEKITDSLVNLMTMQEKVDQLHGTGSTRQSADNTRLGIPGYYMTNGPQGVCTGSLIIGTSTSFPSEAAVANTFDTAIVYKMGTAFGKESFALSNYIFEAPMINMVRDPRAGRDWECFGEDPYLAARISVAYCLGVQSVNCVVMPKHLICNDMETNRKLYSSNVSERTMREIYAMPFEYSVKEGKAWSVMSAYNLVNNIYSSDNAHVLTEMLKTDWGFRGFVASDYKSIHSTIDAVNAGQDVEMPNAQFFGSPLMDAITLRQVDTNRVIDMVKRLVRTKVWAGVIGKLQTAVVRYTSDLKSAAHKQLALDIARKSIVLVKNTPVTGETVPVLPLDKNKTVSVVGPFANIARMDAANSGKTCPYDVSNTPLHGITAKLAAGKVLDATQWQNADVVIAVLGVSGEGEGLDRSSASLEPPSGQISLVNSIIAAGKKCVVVLTGGSAAIKDVWANVPAVVVAWYPGQEQGTALADILFGDVNPSGKLAATWPANANQLIPFSFTNNAIPYESSDTGIGYRYYDKLKLTPLYAFGHGLSYSSFTYSNLQMNHKTYYVGEDVVVSVDITNTSDRDGDEVAQLYLHENNPDAAFPRPVKELRGFARVSIAANQTKSVSFTLREREFAYWDTVKKAFYAKPDDYTVSVGPSSANLPLTGTVTLQSPW